MGFTEIKNLTNELKDFVDMSAFVEDIKIDEDANVEMIRLLREFAKDRVEMISYLTELYT